MHTVIINITICPIICIVLSLFIPYLLKQCVIPINLSNNEVRCQNQNKANNGLIHSSCSRTCDGSKLNQTAIYIRIDGIGYREQGTGVHGHLIE